MTKLKDLKEAIKNTPPERLANIEYQSHFLQMVGVTIVCGIFIWKGFWWIILAFIFSLGISLSQGISAYQKYNAIISITGGTQYDYKNDKSFTRKRDYIIRKYMGKYFWIVSVIISFILCYTLLPLNTWYFKIIFSFSFVVIHLLFYFFPIYWIAKFEQRCNE